MNLILVRHGEISSNVIKVYAGKSSEGLTEKGIRQAHEVAEEIATYNIDSLYSSPVRRAVQTAQIIGNKIDKDYIIEENFREMEMGPWEGLSEQDISQMYPKEWKLWRSSPADLRLPGRETLDDLLSRALRGVQRINRSKDSQKTVIVTHVAIIRVLLLWHTGRSLNLYKTIHIPNIGVFNIDIL
jgi:alpha-ribazole phosphatase/probable phosphoglycerate mutase